MADLSQTLVRIARGRRADPLAPVTVIVPTHLAGLQLRRRLGSLGPFAAVRFETLPRLAELIAGGALAGRARSPLARPIGDYVAAQVALDSRDELSGVRELPGFGRVLRQMFRRLRRGGISTPEQVSVPLSNGYLGELLRLYGDFRSATAGFYDEEDLLEEAAATLRQRRAAVASELEAIYVVPPGALSAGSEAFLRALRAATPRFVAIDEPLPRAAETFVLAPDPASEAREAVREVLAALDEGVGLHEVAIFHGADPSYRGLLSEAFESARVPAASMPGMPLAETVAGRAILLLASLPAEDYSRTVVMDFLAIAPIQPRIPGVPGPISPLPSSWDRLSREAGVTKGADRWRHGLAVRQADLEAELEAQGFEYEARRNAIQYQLDMAGGLRAAIEALISRLEPLRASMPARTFIDRFSAVVDEYLRPDASGLANVKAEIEQLGTVGAVGGSFALSNFIQALRANLEIAAVRERGLGEGVLVADYRVAAGLDFRRVVLCGAFEGSFPAGPGGDTLVDDRDWSRLRESFPFVEDAALRIKRARDAAHRALATAGDGRVTWMTPLFEAGGTREYYPSPLMVEAASRNDPAIRNASDLRRARSSDLVRRPPSPLAAGLRGPALDASEIGLRRAVAGLQAGVFAGPGHRLYPQAQLLRARRGAAFSEFDGNLGALARSRELWASRAASPTSLEIYGACGFRYFGNYLLRLNVVQEPGEREVMDASERGSLMHDVLDAFFKEKRDEGRPRPFEAWEASDLRRLLQIAEERLGMAARRGKTGLDIFADHDARTILADLAAFLEEDNAFRLETGAVPSAFEAQIPPSEVAGVTMRGIVDRVDITPDGKSAWVIDYKTGSATPYRALETGADGPFAGGTRLQLPAYLAAAGDASRVEALYWFVSRQGAFKRIPFTPSRENMANFEATVAAILEGIARGSFPAVPGEENDFFGQWDNCRYCDFTRICSTHRDLDFQHKAGDKAMAPWLRVGATARGDV